MPGIGDEMWETLLGVVVGGLLATGLNYLAETRHWKRDLTLKLLDEMAELPSRAWPDEDDRGGYQELVVMLGRIRARMMMVGLDAALADVLEDASKDHFRNAHPVDFGLEDGGGWAISKEFGDNFRKAMNDVIDAARKRGRR